MKAQLDSAAIAFVAFVSENFHSFARSSRSSFGFLFHCYYSIVCTCTRVSSSSLCDNGLIANDNTMHLC